MGKIKLASCWTWDCPSCGARQFEMGERLPPERERELNIQLGVIEPWQEKPEPDPTAEFEEIDSWFWTPSNVKCEVCQAEYEVDLSDYEQP